MAAEQQVAVEVAHAAKEVIETAVALAVAAPTRLHREVAENKLQDLVCDDFPSGG